jgi:hypothetical protein
MRNLTVVVVVAALFASTAAVSVKHQRQWTEKVDAVVMHAAEQDGAGPIASLIHVRPGSADRPSRIWSSTVSNPAASRPDLVAAQLPASMLRSIAADSDVFARVSRAERADCSIASLRSQANHSSFRRIA